METIVLKREPVTAKPEGWSEGRERAKEKRGNKRKKVPTKHRHLIE